MTVRTMISAWTVLAPDGDFEIKEVLGRKGTRSMDRVTALAVATAGRLLDDGSGGRIRGAGEETALVLGTDHSSAQSMVDFSRDTLTQAKPYFVDPGRFPNTVLNCAAAQCGIWHGLRGPNATVAGGRAAGLLALNYARRLQRSGRARAVLCGAAEELSPIRERLQEPAVLGEGCAMVLLEPAGEPGRHGRPELAEVLAVEFAVGGREELARCVARALEVSGETPDRVRAHISSGGDGEDVLSTPPPVRLDTSDLAGDLSAASAAFALVSALETPGLCLVTALDRDGIVGCALLRTQRGNL